MEVCDLIPHNPREKKLKFSPCIPSWKLRDRVAASQFQLAFKVKVINVVAAVSAIAGAVASIANRIESAWLKLKGPLLYVATEVCDLSKNHQWRPKTWWWNEWRCRWSCTREAYTLWSLQLLEEGRQDGWGFWGKNCLQRKRKNFLQRQRQYPSDGDGHSEPL